MDAKQALRDHGWVLMLLSIAAYIAAVTLLLVADHPAAAQLPGVIAASVAAGAATIGAWWTWDLPSRPGPGWAFALTVPFIASAVICAAGGLYAAAAVFAVIGVIGAVGLVPDRFAHPLMERLGGTDQEHHDQA